MILTDSIQNDYFEWMINLVCGERFADGVSYRKLLAVLHNIEFEYFVPNDNNRAEDGINLRYRFAYHQHDTSLCRYLNGPCSVLEMMVALAIRCEESIMDDTRFGDRTSQWFWNMVANLGLGSITDDRFDKDYIYETIDRFIRRDYTPDGRGGLFAIHGCDVDLRKKEIWYQMCKYLNTIV